MKMYDVTPLKWLIFVTLRALHLKPVFSTEHDISIFCLKDFYEEGGYRFVRNLCTSIPIYTASLFEGL
jgi:hypothetical protein